MNHFHYTRSTEGQARQFLTGSLIGAAIITGIGMFLYSTGKLPESIAKIAPLLLLPVLGVVIWKYRKIKQSNSQWEISVSESLVTWDAPDNLGALNEKSFRLDPSEIDTVLSRFPAGNPSPNYSLVLKNGTEIKLNNQSGVSIQKFVRALSKIGIVEEEVYEK